MFHLSQTHLNLLQTCPPKFQQSYLEQASSLPNLETESKQTWGSRFHLLMQQRELGLPIAPLLKEDAELESSLNALIQAAPELLLHNNPYQTREAEHSRTISYGNYLLTVIYDLLVAAKNQAKIIDWKTYLKPPKKQKLANNWQTRLYLYVLAETSEYLPEQISMTYWFVKLPQKPQSLTFSYSQQQHQKNEADLNLLLSNLDIWLSNYPHTDFPHRRDCQTNCYYYPEFLDSDQADQAEFDLLQEINSIEEISI